MVLGSTINGVRANIENQVPSTEAKKSQSRLHTTLADNRRRRMRGHGNIPKYNVDEAQRKLSKKKKATRAERPESMPQASTSTQALPIQLPQRLPRSTRHYEVTKEALQAVDPALAAEDILPEFLRESLARKAPMMMRVLSSTIIDLEPFRQTGILPRSLDVTIKDTEGIAPTHLLAVYTVKDGKTSPIKLYPAHSIVVAANCARFPPFPAAASSSTSEPSRLHLPVVPLCLPSPETFPGLIHYLYTKQSTALFRSPLLPMVAPGSIMESPSDEHILTFSTKIAQTFTTTALMENIRVVYGTWANVLALGIEDIALWEAMDINWHILLTALALKSKSA